MHLRISLLSKDMLMHRELNTQMYGIIHQRTIQLQIST
jgi:hypothetical protein